MLRDFHRQRFDVDLALHLRQDAAFLRTRRLADELDVDHGLDRLVEAHLVEVDVRDVAAQRILLVVLQDRRVRRLLPLEDDVEDRVQPAGAGQHPPQLALRHADGVRLLALAVEHPRDQPFLPQPPRVGRAAPVALPHLELDAFTRHDGGEV